MRNWRVQVERRAWWPFAPVLAPNYGHVTVYRENGDCENAGGKLDSGRPLEPTNQLLRQPRATGFAPAILGRPHPVGLVAMDFARKGSKAELAIDVEGEKESQVRSKPPIMSWNC